MDIYSMKAIFSSILLCAGPVLTTPLSEYVDGCGLLNNGRYQVLGVFLPINSPRRFDVNGGFMLYRS